MFSKPFRVKSHSQMKASERKKMRTDVEQNFPVLSEEDLKALLPNKEVILSLKVETHYGDQVMVYCVNGEPVIFSLQNVMYPTVYMLWKFPDVLPTFSTWPQVLPRITSGAALMLPGVVLPDGPVSIRSYGDLMKGQRVAVNLTTNRAPVSVGQAALSSEDMYMAVRRGKAVTMLHYIGDHLWGYGSKTDLPQLGVPEALRHVQDEEKTAEGSVDEEDVVSRLEHAVSRLTKKLDALSVDSEATSSTNQPSTSRDMAPRFGNNHVAKQEYKDLPRKDRKNGEDSASSRLLQALDVNPDTCAVLEKKAPDSTEPEPSMDTIVEYCFLKSLKSMLSTKAELPLLTSTFYKLHVMPACPFGMSLEIKKSKYKKLSALLSAMTAEGVLVVKELTKGVQSVMSINANHERLRAFVDVYATSTDEPSTSQAAPKGPKITEWYAVTAAVAPILDTRKGYQMTATQVRSFVTMYVQKHNLHSVMNQSVVLLDKDLRKICMVDDDVMVVTWPHLMGNMLNAMTHSLQIEQPRTPSGAKGGKVEPIEIVVATRSGNKKVTLVYNLELFGIDLNDFAHVCQHGVAASTSISMAEHRKGSQLLIQGNQVHFVGKILQEKHGIPKQYIRGLENAVRPRH